MEFSELVGKTSSLPVFTTGFLAAGENPAQVRLQISRWVNAGKIIRVHKGFYALSDLYKKAASEPFYIANALKPVSYVSLQSALSWHGVIPEYVPACTSVTTGRPQTIETPLGRFEFRHVSGKYFWGYRRLELRAGLHAFVARPEKALLDCIYLTPRGDERAFIEELRLQNFKQIDGVRLRGFAEKFHSPKMMAALKSIEAILDRGEGGEL